MKKAKIVTTNQKNTKKNKKNTEEHEWHRQRWFEIRLGGVIEW